MATKTATKKTKQAAKEAAKFEYGENQQILRDSARKFLAERFRIERVRELMESDDPHDPAAWKEIAELGWHGLLIPEKHGGIGLGLLDLGVLLEEMGEAVMPGPYLAGQLGVLLLLAGADGEQRKLLPRIAGGETLVVPAFTESGGGWNPFAGDVAAKKSGKGWKLSGRKVLVDGANEADYFIVGAQTSGGPTLFLIDAEAKGLKLKAEKLLDETRRSAMVQLRDVTLGEEDVLGRPGGAEKVLADAMPKIWAALAAEMVGAARKVFAIAVDYAKVREQFGRPIGSFQGVKHRLVDRMVEIENARSLVYAALWAQDNGPKARAERTARAAKAHLSEIGPRVADSAVRVHGGIGFTWECDVHLYWKRLRWGAVAYGDARHHRDAIAAEVVKGKL